MKEPTEFAEGSRQKQIATKCHNSNRNEIQKRQPQMTKCKPCGRFSRAKYQALFLAKPNNFTKKADRKVVQTPDNQTFKQWIYLGRNVPIVCMERVMAGETLQQNRAKTCLPSKCAVFGDPSNICHSCLYLAVVLWDSVCLFVADAGDPLRTYAIKKQWIAQRHAQKCQGHNFAFAFQLITCEKNRNKLAQILLILINMYI